jgi:hypothetical protein
VRDAVNAYGAARGITLCADLPEVAETWDGWLSTPGPGVTARDVFAALDGAQSGPVTEGNARGGTGMICHKFKGGTGTASPPRDARWGGLCARRAGAGQLWSEGLAARERRASGPASWPGGDSFRASTAEWRRFRFAGRRPCDRCTAAATAMPAPGQTGSARNGTHRRHRRRRKWRHFPGVFNCG